MGGRRLWRAACRDQLVDGCGTMSKSRPVWPGQQRRPSGGLAEAGRSSGRPRHGLALRGASGEPAGRGLRHLIFDVGEDASHTTVHADLFDNLYVVVRGEKRFSLLPPQEGHLLRRRLFPAATYRPTAVSGGGGGGGGGGGVGASGLELALDDPPEQQVQSALGLQAVTA